MRIETDSHKIFFDLNEALVFFYGENIRYKEKLKMMINHAEEYEADIKQQEEAIKNAAKRVQ